MEQELPIENEWIISIRPLNAVNKRKAITACEQTINRNGRLLNYKKQKIAQLKFSCEFSIENISTFLRELQKNFSIENHISPDAKKIIDGKKATDQHIIILILTI